MRKPVLQAMVLADHVYQDKFSGKFIIAGTFSVIFRGQKVAAPNDGPTEIEGDVQKIQGLVTEVGSPYLYLALTEIHEKVPLKLKLIDLSDASVLLEAEFSVIAQDPTQLTEAILPMPKLPIANFGTYSLDLLHDEETLGTWRLYVKPVPHAGTGDSP